MHIMHLHNYAKSFSNFWNPKIFITFYFTDFSLIDFWLQSWPCLVEWCVDGFNFSVGCGYCCSRDQLNVCGGVREILLSSKSLSADFWNWSEGHIGGLEVNEFCKSSQSISWICYCCAVSSIQVRWSMLGIDQLELIEVCWRSLNWVGMKTIHISNCTLYFDIVHVLINFLLCQSSVLAASASSSFFG